MNEKQKVLTMLQEGKITVEETEKLLNAIKEKSATTKLTVLKNDAGKNLKGKLKIEIASADDEDVNIVLPLKIASIAKNFIPKDAKMKMENNDINLGSLLENLDDLVGELDEDLVNINSSDGDKVRIYIEK